ncbi:MAG: hypothetical protein H0X51_10230 [Parachlamydiaceae bacterium]|nr:hypothetical protein [Parachlamydiaceae bacterium]
MKLLKFLLPIMIVGVVAAYADEDGEISRHNESLNTRDLESLRRFVNEKRFTDLEDKSKNLSISGDVRTEWRHMTEEFCGHRVRGGNGQDCRCIPLGKNDFDIEFNLKFDYAQDNAWAYAHLQYDNSAGTERIDCNCTKNICGPRSRETGRCSRSDRSERKCTANRFHGSGSVDGLNLKRAYMGYNIFTDSCGNELDIEIGRRPLYDVFESEIQFDNRMDGALLKYAGKWECVANWYAQVGGWVVDERVSHFAYAAEIAFFDICDSGFDAKYSFIDWRKHGINRCYIKNPRAMKYANSQVVLTYHLDPETICVPVEIYGAVLYNHLAHQAIVPPADLNFGGDVSANCTCGCDDLTSRNKNKRWGFYGGITVGEVDVEGDWSFDIQYQYVQQYAIAYDDENGIGLGNATADCCGSFPTTGYQGVRFDALYALTDNLTIQTIIDWGKSTEREKHTYSKLELEAIYAF